jgi:hypothetical protein
MNMRKALIYIMLLFCARTLWAQDADLAQISDTLAVQDSAALPSGKLIPMQGAFLQQLQERDSVLIADQLLYGFELKQVKEGTQLVLPEIPQEQDYRLMFLTPWTLDTVKVSRQKKGLPRFYDLKGSVRIASFEEGIYDLAPIAVQRMNEDGVTDTLLFEPLRLEVKTMPVDTASFVPHDIKGQIRYPLTLAEVLPWASGAWLLIMLTILAVCLVMIHRRKNDPAFEHKEPAHIVALRKLDQYRGNKMWAPEKQKSFYSGVTDTLREYIAARYGVSAMEMTTAEIFEDLKSTDAPKEIMAEVKELFERADFVKFAKYVASDEDNAAALPIAVRFVTETYQAEIESDKEGGE